MRFLILVIYDLISPSLIPITSKFIPSTLSIVLILRLPYLDCCLVSPTHIYYKYVASTCSYKVDL